MGTVQNRNLYDFINKYFRAADQTGKVWAHPPNSFKKSDVPKWWSRASVYPADKKRYVILLLETTVTQARTQTHVHTRTHKTTHKQRKRKREREIYMERDDHMERNKKIDVPPPDGSTAPCPSSFAASSTLGASIQHRPTCEKLRKIYRSASFAQWVKLSLIVFPLSAACARDHKIEVHNDFQLAARGLSISQTYLCRQHPLPAPVLQIRAMEQQQPARSAQAHAYTQYQGEGFTLASDLIPRAPAL